MGRYTIPSFSKRFEVTVGYDRPMNTFFAQVEDLSLADAEDPIVLWIGASFSEIQNPEALQPLISRYATIPEEILTELHADRAGSLDRGDSPLQRMLRMILDGDGP